MARARRLPTLDKRALLHATNAPRQQLLAQADFHLAEGALYDALDFFEKARDAEGLNRVRDAAIEDGDATLLAWIERNGLAELTAAHWLAAGENARKAGKFHDAARAFEKAGDPAKAQQARTASTPQPTASDDQSKE